MTKPHGSISRALAGVAGALVLAATWSFAATFTVSNTNDSGPGSLRQAILDANATAGADTIAFDIPGMGVHTLSPLSPLPELTDEAGVTIDGYTQPGSSPNTLAVGDDAALMIEIDGSMAGETVNGLVIRGLSATVRGLVVNRFDRIGIWIAEGHGHKVSGCFLGTDPTGQIARGNRLGLLIDTLSGSPAASTAPLPTTVTVGGLTPADRNLISGNSSTGLLAFFAANSLIQGNYIGTDASGEAALANQGGGVSLLAAGTVLGGMEPAAMNVISGNVGSGVLLSFGGENIIANNRIGTDASGTAAVPNGAGIQLILEAARDDIFNNLISGNTVNGIRIFNSVGTRVYGNLIGTDRTGTLPIGNGARGVFVLASSFSVVVGADSPNVIAYNAGPGVSVGFDPSDLSSGVVVSGNSIHDNGGLGIDLADNGVTPGNDCGSGAGPNLLQNAPVLTAAATSGAITRIQGTLNSTPGFSFTLEFFSNGSCDPSGYGEGARFLGSAQATTDASCNASFDVTLPVGVAPGSFVTASATDAAGNTSEFSSCRPASEEQPALTALSPAKIWVGLKNSDDVGLRLDLKAEVFRNGSLIGSGELNGISGGSSGFNRAILDQIPLTLFAPAVLLPGDTLSIKLSVRAGAVGHRSGTARLWFNDSAADSHFGATIGGASVGFYLREGFVLRTSPGPGPKRTIDVFVDRAAGGNPFKPLGTWSKTL